MRSAELINEARLAHPWLCRKVDDAEFGAGFVEPAFEYLQFAFTPHEGAEAAAEGCLKPRRAPPNGVEAIGFLRFSPSPLIL